MTKPVDISATQRCPICSKPSAEQVRPFCSRRYADIDLHRWLSGVYAVPGHPDEDEDGRRDEDHTPTDEVR